MNNITRLNAQGSITVYGMKPDYVESFAENVTLAGHLLVEFKGESSAFWNGAYIYR